MTLSVFALLAAAACTDQTNHFVCIFGTLTWNKDKLQQIAAALHLADQDPHRAHALQVYKSHLTEGRAPSGPAVDSARQNLASTFVNAFVNAGFGQDKLMTVIPDNDSSENVHWIFKNKVS